MAKFFNKTKGPVSFDLADGTPVVVSPKSYLEIPGEISISAELGMLLRKGVLQLFISPPPTTPKAAVALPVVTPPAVVAPVLPEAPKVDLGAKSLGGRTKFKVEPRNFKPAQVVSAPPVVAVETVKVEADIVVSPAPTTPAVEPVESVDSKAATLE